MAPNRNADSPMYNLEFGTDLSVQSLINAGSDAKPNQCMMGGAYASNAGTFSNGSQNNNNTNNQQNKPLYPNRSYNNNRDHRKDGDDDKYDGTEVADQYHMQPCQRWDCRAIHEMSRAQTVIIRKLRLQQNRLQIAHKCVQNNTSKKQNSKRTNKYHRVGYDPSSSMFRAQENVKIEDRNALWSTLKEQHISKHDRKDYLDKSIAIQCLADKVQYNNAAIGTKRTLDLDLHHNAGGKAYFVIERVESKSHRDYPWKLWTAVYTEQQLKRQYLPRPVSARESHDFITQQNYEIEIGNILQHKMDEIMHNQKWTRIKVFYAIDNEELLTLKLTQQKFLKHYDRFVQNESKEQDNEMKQKLIPIVMFDTKSVQYIIQYIRVITIDKTMMGISFKYHPNQEKNQITVTGIHLDKKSIRNQHQLVSPQHEDCHCLDHFVEHNISFIKIGQINANEIRQLRRIGRISILLRTIYDKIHLYIRNLWSAVQVFNGNHVV
eukprot:639308_1